MKIIHVCHNYYPSKGGPQYTMRHLSEQFANNYKDNVTVLTTDSYYGPESALYKKIKPATEMINGVEVRRFSFWRWHYPVIKYGGKIKAKLTGSGFPYSIAKWRYGMLAPSLNKAMDKISGDVIMATSGIYNFCDYPAWRFSTNNPRPFVLYGAYHFTDTIKDDNPYIERAKICDCYISNTAFERQLLIDHGVDAGKVVNIGTGIAPETFYCSADVVQKFKREHNITENDIVIGYAGRLAKGKGVADLLSAFRKLYAENKKIKLLLAGGTTEYVAEIIKARDEEKLPVILIENFDDNMKPVLYNVLDIFVLASQSESFGVVYLESWACKKPVVSSRLDAVASLLSEGQDSLMFPLNDVDALVAQLKLLVGDKNLQKRLGENGYNKVMANFTWPVITEKYRNAYLKGIENFNRKYSVKKSV